MRPRRSIDQNNVTNIRVRGIISTWYHTSTYNHIYRTIRVRAFVHTSFFTDISMIRCFSYFGIVYEIPGSADTATPGYRFSAIACWLWKGDLSDPPCKLLQWYSYHTIGDVRNIDSWIIRVWLVDGSSMNGSLTRCLISRALSYSPTRIPGMIWYVVMDWWPAAKLGWGDYTQQWSGWMGCWDDVMIVSWLTALRLL